MTSTLTLSEEMLADEACGNLASHVQPTILIGGLGLGFSLRRVLELVGKKATVEVSELLPDLVEWNREFLGDLNGKLLEDPRVRVIEGDVYDCIAKAGTNRYDAMLLDVDNGPSSPVLYENARIYARRTLIKVHSALKPGGRVSFWSAGKEKNFPGQLKRIGFEVHETRAMAHKRAKSAAHWIYTGQRRG